MSAGQMPASTLGFEHVLERGIGATTLLLLHATGADERQLIPIARALAPDATLLSPRGKVLEDGVTRRFFARHSAFDLDIPDLLARTGELARFVRASVTSYELDPHRIVALGYSNGANIAVSLLFQEPGLLKGAALLRPTLPYEPTGAMALGGTAALIAAGAHDPMVPDGKPQRLADILTTAGADVTVAIAAAAHGLVDTDFAALQQWLEREGAR
jgi:predicted esterase